MRLLLAGKESEPLTVVLSSALRGLGHEVDTVGSAEAALRQAADERYALAVVIYETDGATRHFLASYRDVDPLLQAIVISDTPTTEAAVEVLRGGAAAQALDYITVPEPRLIQRLQRVIDHDYARIRLGPWTYNRKELRLHFMDQLIDLTDMEHRLMACFVLRPYEDIPYTMLAQAAHHEPLNPRTAVRTLKAHVSRLRSKLREAAGREVIHSDRHQATLRFIPGSRSFRGATAEAPQGAARGADGDGAIRGARSSAGSW